MPWRKPIRRLAQANLAVLALLLGVIVNTALVIGVLHINTSRIADNRERIRDIQESRVFSCRQTYRAFHLVFDPFLPKPEMRTPRQREDIAAFNKTVDMLIAGCGHQTRTEERP